MMNETLIEEKTKKDIYFRAITFFIDHSKFIFYYHYTKYPLEIKWFKTLFKCEILLILSEASIKFICTQLT